MCCQVGKHVIPAVFSIQPTTRPVGTGNILARWPATHKVEPMPSSALPLLGLGLSGQC